MFHYLIWVGLSVFFVSCSSVEDVRENSSSKGEFISRLDDEFLFSVDKPQLQPKSPYPWTKEQIGNQLKITKEFFRCKGSSLNPPHIIQEKGEMVRYHDCGGAEKHSLPLRDDKEFIYPILIELLNYIQTKTKKKVVITSGHRCPEHNSYVDSSPSNNYSKHMVGAEVSFYVQGMEEQPEKIIALLQEYYKTSKYQGKKDFVEFKRFEKGDLNVSTQPWYNKEVFFKLFKKKEGRNFDNRHPYPYLSIQVRYDEELKERVSYSWDKAFHNYMRY